LESRKEGGTVGRLLMKTGICSGPSNKGRKAFGWAARGVKKLRHALKGKR